MTVATSLPRIVLVAGLSVLIPAGSALGQSILWSKAGGYGAGRSEAGMSGLAPSSSRSLAVDPSGDLFLTGYRGNGGPSDFLTSKYRSSDGTLLWSKTFNGPGDSADGAVAIVLDAAGNAIVAGVAFSGKNVDFKTIKYAGTDGAVMWERTFNGADDRDDSVAALAIDSSGNVVVTGTSVTASGTRDISTVKYAASDGTTVWQRTYAGPSNAEDRATSVAVDAAGDAVVTGYSFVGGGATLITLKYAAADGATSWERAFSGGAGQTAKSGALALDASGNAIVAGALHDGATTRYRTIKYAAADGTEMWNREFAGTAGRAFDAYAAVVDLTGNVVVAGAGHNGINIIWEVVKYAAGDGAVLWSHTRLGVAGGINLAVAVAIDSAGDPVVTGAVFNGTSSDFLTIKYSGADGTPLWLTSLDDPSNQHDSARAVVLDAAGDAYVAGEYFDAPSIDIRIRKYASSDGAVLWTSQPTTGPLRALLAGDLRGRGMARDADGNLVVLGTNFNGSSASLRLLKYASADGALMWERAFDIGGNSGDHAVAVAVDPSGGVIVAGTAYGGIFGQFRTLKFGADGSGPLWQKAFTSGFGSGSFVADLAVDAAGNAIVTGSSSAPGSATDFRTIKYAAADGAVLWERSFTSAGSDFDFPWAIALDAQGNVIVAGQGGDGLFGRDYKTIKYAAADGATIWERSFAGVVGGWDSVRAVATDAAGNVIVTGLSDNGFDSDIVTIKYAAADGATLWTRTIAGAAGVGDQPKAVAVDRDGNALVTGYAASAVSPGRRGYLTFKLAAGDGAVLWTASHEGATGSDHSAYALAVDGAGNAIVTGASHNGVVSEFRTIKYRAADGTVAWNHVHNAGAYGGFAAAAMPGAVDVAGNCVADGRPRGICTIRFENKSAATMRLLAAASSVAGQAVTFDASSSAPADPDAPLTGTFTFRDGATMLCTGTSTTCTVSNLAPGSHAITVTFEGNALVEAASSAPLTHSVFATPAGIPRLVNIATRLPVLTGDDVLIGGFIIGGTQPKTVVVRARGPSLAASGVSGALANPVLQLFAGATSIAANDDWGTAANAAALQASGYAPANVFESAILTTLGPGAYTAIVTGAGGLTGVGIVEVFEVDRPEVPLVNIATRGRVLTGNDVMIGGFIIQGDAPQTVVVRARGPSLIPFGFANALGDPVLQLFSGATPIATNDNWQAATNAAAIQASGFAPSNANESAILITLAPGAYTAIVTGAGNTTGVGIIEVFAQ